MLETELRESIHNEAGHINIIDLDDISIPPFKEHLDEDALEEIAKQVID